MGNLLNNRSDYPFDVRLLSECPQYFDTVLHWLHDEWCATSADQRGHSQQQLTHALLQRSNKLRAHLDSEQLPISFIALSKGTTPAGIVSLTNLEADDRQNNIAWLSNLFVVPGYRNRGLAAALINRCEMAAKEFHIETLNLLTPQAETYYVKLGWQVVRRVLRAGETYSLMRKTVE